MTEKLPQGGPGECATCGARLTGRFCSECGAPAAKSIARTGWLGAVNDLTGLESQISPFATLWKILRGPLTVPVDLALDPAFRGHVAFFAFGLALLTSAFFVGLPRLLAWAGDLQVGGDSGVVGKLLTVQYVLVILLMPVTYHLYRMLSAEPRRQASYYKIYLMGTVLGSLLFVFVFTALLGTWLAVVTYTDFDPPDDAATIVTILRAMMAVASFTGTLYTAILAARFWKLPYAWTLAIGLMAGVVAELAALPLLTIVERVMSYLW